MTATEPVQGVAPPPPPDLSDNRARTHLANERTFLAWLRTGLSLIAVGLAAARFLPLGLVPGIPYVTIFAILLVLAGTALVLLGGQRYAISARQIDRGQYRPASHLIEIVALVVAVLGIMSLPLALLLR